MAEDGKARHWTKQISMKTQKDGFLERRRTSGPDCGKTNALKGWMRPKDITLHRDHGILHGLYLISYTLRFADFARTSIL